MAESARKDDLLGAAYTLGMAAIPLTMVYFKFGEWPVFHVVMATLTAVFLLLFTLGFVYRAVTGNEPILQLRGMSESE